MTQKMVDDWNSIFQQKFRLQKKGNLPWMHKLKHTFLHGLIYMHVQEEIQLSIFCYNFGLP